jgi:radical SAM-linked protein
MSDTTTTEPKQRIRITFGKLGALKYVGHLDLAKMWERILRRTQINLAYSQGYNARPKMQLAAPLSLGITSEAELIDVWLDEVADLAGLAERLRANSPSGLPSLAVTEIALKAPALPSLTESALYQITPPSPADMPALLTRAEALMAKKQVVRTRKDRPYDFRALLVSLRPSPDGDHLWAEMTLQEQATGRPDELLDELALPPYETRVHRLAITLRSWR